MPKMLLPLLAKDQKKPLRQPINRELATSPRHRAAGTDSGGKERGSAPVRRPSGGRRRGELTAPARAGGAGGGTARGTARGSPGHRRGPGQPAHAARSRQLIPTYPREIPPSQRQHWPGLLKSVVTTDPRVLRRSVPPRFGEKAAGRTWQRLTLCFPSNLSDATSTPPFSGSETTTKGKTPLIPRDF